MAAALFQLLLMILPWGLRRRALRAAFGFDIAATAHIGLSVIACKHFTAGDGVSVGHFNSFRNLDDVALGNHVVIGNFNWFSATPSGHPAFYADQPDRRPSLRIGEHASISSRHHFDCTDAVEIGAFTVIAGLNTQILTHGIDVGRSRQVAGPVRIGRGCFIGSRTLFVKGSAVPDFCILAAGAVVAGPLVGDYGLFGGVPARRIRDLPRDSLFFSRPTGVVV